MLSALWRRLDVPGHDAAHVYGTEDGWRLEGVAAFAHERGPVRLVYLVDCAPDWRTRRASVAGWVGAERCDLAIVRHDDGRWMLNGTLAPAVAACVDVDFGFTPATNFLQLRRAALHIGETADFPVAWIDVPDSPLIALPQRYERRSETTYWYESPQDEYAALLELAASGFVRRYPNLWEIEDGSIEDGRRTRR